MAEGLKRAKMAAKATREPARETVYDFESLAKDLESLAEELPDDITLEDVKRNPRLGRVLCAADALCNPRRLRRDAEDWVKDQSEGGDDWDKDRP